MPSFSVGAYVRGKYTNRLGTITSCACPARASAAGKTRWWVCFDPNGYEDFRYEEVTESALVLMEAAPEVVVDWEAVAVKFHRALEALRGHDISVPIQVAQRILDAEAAYKAARKR